MNASMNASTSQTRTQTPIRAKPSTLLSRAVATIPPASQTYELTLKSVLSHRLRSGIFLYSAVFCWIPAFFWNTWNRGGPGLTRSIFNVFSPSTFALLVAFWLFGSLPPTVLRKVYLTATPTTSSSPSKTVRAAFSTRSTYVAMLTYVASAASLSILHVAPSYMNDPGVRGEPRLAIFVKSRKHPHYLNGRFLFLVLSQVICACVFLLRHIMLDRFVVRWPPASAYLSLDARHSSLNASRIATTVTIFTALSIATSAVLFGLTRMLLLPFLFQIPVVRTVLKPFAAHFLRGPWTLSLPLRHVGLLFRCFALGSSTVATWEVSESLFDVYIAEPIIVSPLSAEPILTLISGTTSSSTYFQYFAYSELRELVWEDSQAGSARRTALFADQKYNPSMWTSLCRAALLQLGKDYQHFLRRGAPPPDAPALAPAPPQPKKPDPPSTPLIRKPIFKPSPASPLRSVIDSLGSEGVITQAIASTAEVGVAHVPELFRSVAAVTPAEVKESTDAVVAEVKEITGLIEKLNPLEVTKKIDLGDIVEKHCPRPIVAAGESLMEWWRKDRLAKAADEYLPNRELDFLILQVLTHLTCLSLNEDRYGVVQRDIPRIIEAMISFLSAVEDYQSELVRMWTPPTEEDLANLTPQELEVKNQLGLDVALAIDAVRPIGDALNESVARITRTFGGKLSGFRFSPRIARRLQGFVDYNARLV